MKRTSLFLDDKIVAQMQRLAKRRGVSFATVVREAMATYVARPSPDGISETLPSITGRFASAHGDTASRVDELLWRDPHA